MDSIFFILIAQGLLAQKLQRDAPNSGHHLPKRFLKTLYAGVHMTKYFLSVGRIFSWFLGHFASATRELFEVLARAIFGCVHLLLQQVAFAATTGGFVQG